MQFSLRRLFAAVSVVAAIAAVLRVLPVEGIFFAGFALALGLASFASLSLPMRLASWASDRNPVLEAVCVWLLCPPAIVVGVLFGAGCFLMFAALVVGVLNEVCCR